MSLYMQWLIRGLGVIVSAASAIIVTTILLYFMQSLIQTGRKEIKISPSFHLVEFVRTRQETNLAVKRRKPKPPPIPDDMPPQIQEPDFDQSVNPDSSWAMTSGFQVEVPTNIGGPGLMMASGEYLPLVKVQPVYPRAALQRSLVGWVVVEFTVSEIGSVKDPVVVSNCAVMQFGNERPECVDQPNPIFDRAAMNAASKFKYKPKIIDGVPMATAGVQNKITFELADE